ncbi:MAG TPA: hypothetical protein VKG66_01990, partial [Steroidobacteraceae bacterium]|nr:hypothetical protein [Steroidobacteraceae bacterium]
MNLARSLGSSLLGVWLAGCAVGPNYHAPNTELPREFTGSAATAATAGPAPPAVDSSRWWQALQDPELDSLIDRAIRANFDIEIALTRLQQVRTKQAILVGDALPEVAASGAAGRG